LPRRGYRTQPFDALALKPGNHPIKRIALKKGRVIRVRLTGGIYACDLEPLQGSSQRKLRFPGLKPWARPEQAPARRRAESYSPFGANKTSQTCLTIQPRAGSCSPPPGAIQDPKFILTRCLTDTIQCFELHWNAQRIQPATRIINPMGSNRSAEAVGWRGYCRRFRVNSWLTPLRLRSLIGLYEVSAPSGVSGCAYREYHGQSRDSAPA
jgi:hypothetical protein